MNAQVSYFDWIPDTIKLINPSFEGKTARGGEIPWNLRGWKDLGSEIFQIYTSPDIHPGNFWKNDQTPSDGISYVGLVARADGSYEAIAQTLWKSLKKGSTYEFSLDLCIPYSYYSPVRNNGKEKIENFNNPVKLKIQATYKGEIIELVSSPVINHTDWRKYHFTIKPKHDIENIILTAVQGKIRRKNCALLIDNASDIIEKLP